MAKKTIEETRPLQTNRRSDSMILLAEYGDAQLHVAVWNDPMFSGNKTDSQIVAEAAECLKEFAASKFFKRAR